MLVTAAPTSRWRASVSWNSRPAASEAITMPALPSISSDFLPRRSTRNTASIVIRALISLSMTSAAFAVAPGRPARSRMLTT
jgi:hypothetical protein